MTTTTTKSAFREGLVAGLPFFFVGGPFALLFGVLATEAGLDIWETIGFSVVVIAGSSQFTALQLMSENAPVWIVIAASLAVNLRMAMYSASLQPHLGAAKLWQRAMVAYLNLDQSYAVSIQAYEERPERSVQDKFLFFMGSVTLICPAWYVFTVVGALVGTAIPESWALDFVMPVLFLSLVGPMLKTMAHLLAALTSIVMALALAFLPSGVGLLLAGLAAMAVGAEVERRMGRA
jgi:4-azaleucine resistance transporter AzlC